MEERRLDAAVNILQPTCLQTRIAVVSCDCNSFPTPWRHEWQGGPGHENKDLFVVVLPLQLRRGWDADNTNATLESAGMSVETLPMWVHCTCGRLIVITSSPIRQIWSNRDVTAFNISIPGRMAAAPPPRRPAPSLLYSVCYTSPPPPGHTPDQSAQSNE